MNKIKINEKRRKKNYRNNKMNKLMMTRIINKSSDKSNSNNNISHLGINCCLGTESVSGGIISPLESLGPGSL